VIAGPTRNEAEHAAFLRSWRLRDAPASGTGSMAETPRRLLMALVVLLVLTACSSSTAPNGNPLDGTWSGDSLGYTLTFSVTESNSYVSGSGTISGNGLSESLDVTGSYYAKGVGLTLTAPDSSTVSYTGKLVSPDELDGTLWLCDTNGRCLGGVQQNAFALDVKKK